MIAVIAGKLLQFMFKNFRSSHLILCWLQIWSAKSLISHDTDGTFICLLLLWFHHWNLLRNWWLFNKCTSCCCPYSHIRPYQ